MTKNRALCLILLAGLALLPSFGLTAQDSDKTDTETSDNNKETKDDKKGDGKEGTGELELAENAEALLKLVTTKEMESAIKSGLKSLAGLQDEKTGSFGSSVRVANTALAGLALLGSGSLPNSGPYGKHLTKIVEWLLKIQDPTTGYMALTDDGSRIHGHGYATLFLSQIYGQADKSLKIKLALSKAIKCLEAGQTKEGGWGYVPDDKTWDEGSTTVCVLQALRAAQSAGIAVKNKTIAKAIGYMEKIAVAQTIKIDDELVQAYTFMYSLSTGSSSQSYALVAAGASCINNIGVYSKSARWKQKDIGKILDGSMHWLMYTWKNNYFSVKAGGQSALSSYHFYYANQYACQAAWQYEDVEYFKYYFPKMRDLLVQAQKRNGGRLWNHSYGKCYATSLALMILQIPYQYLPAFQR